MKTIVTLIIIGMTVESAVGCDVELEGVAGLSAIAIHVPRITLTPWLTTPKRPVPISKPEKNSLRVM